MRPLPFLAAALTAFAVAACAVAPAPVPDASTGSVIDAQASSSSRRSAPSPSGPSTYVSPQGFSIELPERARIGAGATSPIVAFEDEEKGRVFIATTSYDDPSTPEADRLPTTIDLLRGTDASWVPHWTMDVTPIEDDAALDTWVKNHYGPGCSVEERAPTAQPGVEDVLLASDGLPMDSSRCVLNYIYEIRYQPSKKRVLSWELGQAPQFTAADTENILDLRMRDSVRMTD